MPTKLGVTFDWRGASIAGISELSKAADELGYDSFWIPEAWGTEGFAASAHVLNQTKHIKVRTGVLNTYSRSAAVLGMGSLTLLQIDPKRFSLGLGTSGRRLVEDWHGVKFDQPLGRMREYVEVIKKVVRGGVVDYKGKVLNLSRFRAYTEIPHGDDFKIYLAALGDKSLRLAGEISDGAIVIFYSMQKLGHALEQLNAFPSDKVRELVAIIPAEVTNSSDEERALLSMKKRISFYISSMGVYYARLLADSGFSEIVGKVNEAHGRGEKERALDAVTRELVDELCLLGNPEEIRRKIDALKGVTPVLGLRISSQEEVADSLKTLRALAPD
jgi:alkanesulfonate monooxygenase SsuD/methylene tetrahydromethanopterin reductase-like flavin-dependent oxidoreductase (luciferase family)